MTDPQPVTDIKKLAPGDRLVHPRGATAKVLSLSAHRRNKHELHGYVCVVTQTNGGVQRCTIPLTAINDKGWRVATEAEADQLNEAELAKWDVAKKGSLLGQLAAEAPPSGMTERAEADDPRDWDAARRDYERELYAKIDAEDAAEMNPPSTEQIEKVDAETEAGLLIIEQQLIDRDLAEVANVIRNLREINSSLEEQLEAARETRNSAIDTATEASNHAASLQSQLVELEARNGLLEKGLDERDHVITDLLADADKLEANFDTVVDSLSKREAAIRVLEGHIERLESRPVATTSELVTSKVEVKTLEHILYRPEARIKSDQELADHLNDGWEKWDCETTDGLRTVVLVRQCQLPPVTPQPERAAAKVVVPDAIVFEGAAPTPAEVSLQEAELITAHHTAAAAASPLPRFNAQDYMEGAFEAALGKAQVAGAANQTAYDAIFNTPRQLPAEVVRPS